MIIDVAFIVLIILSVGVVLNRCLCVISKISHKKWDDGFLNFVFLSLGYTLMGCGALSILMLWQGSVYMLIVGLAIKYIFDRRRGD